MKNQQDNKVLILELSEVPWKVIDSYAERYPQSTFARIMHRSGRLTTHLPDTGQLHPKTSWQTFHRGVPDNVHGIREHNQLHSNGQRNNPTMWSLARQAGKRVGCGASIGSWPLPESEKNIDFWFADPFSPDAASIPDCISSFQAFNTLAVARSSRQVRAGGVSYKAISKFLLNALRLGIKATTVARVAKQLISERFNPARAVRRRNIQALMSFDVAQKQWHTSQPHLSSIFVNHVAAAMHRYWAAAFPDDYETKNMPEHWRATYKDEIDEAMNVADHMLARILKSINGKNTTLLIVSSMGQKAIEHEPTFNQLAIQDVPKFLSLLGFCKGDYEQRPSMQPEYVLAFRTAALLKRFIQTCQEVDINGKQPKVKQASDTECSLLVDQYNVGFDSIVLNKRKIPMEHTGLFIEQIQDIAGSTSRQTVDGIAMVVSPSHNLSYLNDYSEEVDLCGVTAAVLESLHVPVPDYMPTPLHELVLALQASKVKESANVSKQNSTHRGGCNDVVVL